jgi:methionine-rich copper-binding protein CopC
VDKHDTRLDKSDGVTLRVSLPALAAGQYRVEWRAVSTDSHKIQGGYTFRVKP